jgi:hypothetical protein
MQSILSELLDMQSQEHHRCTIPRACSRSRLCHLLILQSSGILGMSWRELGCPGRGIDLNLFLEEGNLELLLLFHRLGLRDYGVKPEFTESLVVFYAQSKSDHLS